MSRVLAIANCRVSTEEQEKNGSLPRQEAAVRKAANDLGAELIKIWSGSVSSKKGRNLDRPDLRAMLTACRENRNIRYAIFDEPDRFMRSMLEAAHFIVEFQKLKVEVIFAEQPNLKTDTAANTLMLLLETFKAEGSNEERQRKSINGHEEALRGGRFTFPCRFGYIKGSVPGIHEPHVIIAPILTDIMERIAQRRISPPQGMKELNASDAMVGRAPFKMDKFRKLLEDPYYCGVVSMDKQVQITNPDGLHEPLISPGTHQKLIEVMRGRPKSQTGGMKGGNPDFPLSSRVIHKPCMYKKKHKLVGCPVNNGKNKEIKYMKYRCFACGLYIDRDELHNEVMQQFKKHPMTDRAQLSIAKALEAAWTRREREATKQMAAISHRIDILTETKDNQAVEAINPENALIKSELLASVVKIKAQIVGLETELHNLRTKTTASKSKFLCFALDFVANMASRFLTISRENRLRLELMLFPDGFLLNQDKKVLTPKISPFYRLTSIKKEPFGSQFSTMVRVRGL